VPMYEYQCKKCKHVFEKIMQYSDKPLKNCPDCGAKNSLEQTISAPAFQFKGAGWYVTDYAKSGGAKTGSDNTDKSDKTADKAGTESSSTDSSGDSESSAKLVENKPTETKSSETKSGKKETSKKKK